MLYIYTYQPYRACAFRQKLYNYMKLEPQQGIERMLVWSNNIDTHTHTKDLMHAVCTLSHPRQRVPRGSRFHEVLAKTIQTVNQNYTDVISLRCSLPSHPSFHPVSLHSEAPRQNLALERESYRIHFSLSIQLFLREFLSVCECILAVCLVKQN